jgi:hypothetical protein
MGKSRRKRSPIKLGKEPEGIKDYASRLAHEWFGPEVLVSVVLALLCFAGYNAVVHGASL